MTSGPIVRNEESKINVVIERTTFVDNKISLYRIGE